MKAKGIFYGWCASWLFLFAGVGTWENSEFGSPEALLGILLCLVWFVFSLLLIANERECLEEAEKMERWIDEHVLNGPGIQR